MNEISHIHLGRQPYTISVEAHRALKAYLQEIHRQVGDKEVVDEVELRMSELLTERGVTGDKVVLPDDVDFLKQQLGDPADFADDNDAPAEPKADTLATKRLFRDTDTALIAGVSGGLSAYFGLDVTLIRLLFIILTIFGGGIGLVVYIVLWLATPPAESASEKLQMQGKPVTLGALKDSVSSADLSDTARRAGGTFLSVINKLLAVLIKILSVGFILAGIGILFGLVATKAYMLLHHGQLFQENIFPIGAREQLLVWLGLGLGVIVAIFLMLAGIASFKRKWPLKSWATGVLAGIFVLGFATLIALSADVAPRVRERYIEGLHTTAVKNIQPFDTVKSTGGVDITYIPSPTYAVSLHYFDHPDTSTIKFSVKNHTLFIDSTAFDNTQHCTMLCLFPRYDMTVQVSAPNIRNFDLPDRTDLFYPPPVPSID